jgi:hypothetical protein
MKWLILGLLCGIAVGQVPSGSIPATLFGLTYMDGRDYPATPLLNNGSLAKGVAVSWHYVQPSSSCTSPGPCATFLWSGVDNYTGLASSHGVDFFYDFDTGPAWASSNTGTYCGNSGNSADECTGGFMANGAANFQNFVTALVQRYDGTTGHGRIYIYEIWNEIQNPQDWTDSMANLAVLARIIVTTVRANDIARSITPHTLIGTPSFYSPSTLASFMSAYVSAGGSASDFDSVDFHAYLGTNVSNCGGLPVPCAEEIVPIVSGIQSQMTTSGLTTQAIFDTEGSWGTDSLTTVQQVGFTARWYLMHWSSNVRRMMWYAADNASWGLLCSGGPPCTVNAAGVAYNQVASWMVGSTMGSSGCTEASTIYTCPITSAASIQELAVWNTSGSSSYSPAPQYKTYKDLAGGTTAISGSITIGVEPLLLVSAPLINGQVHQSDSW